MVITDWFIYLAIGITLIFVWRKSPYSKWIGQKSTFLKELQDCNLCIGFWVYFILAIVMQINMFEFYVIGVSQFLSAVVTATFFYILAAGWDTLFRNIIISGNE